jgi:hypothetical protein
VRQKRVFFPVADPPRNRCEKRTQLIAVSEKRSIEEKQLFKTHLKRFFLADPKLDKAVKFFRPWNRKAAIKQVAFGNSFYLHARNRQKIGF